MKKITFLLFAALVLASMSSAVSAAECNGYPAPEQAGFHHCALIYDNPVRGVHEFTPYVIRTLPSGEIRSGEWLFDAYLFLIFTTPGGVRTDSGPTRMADWQYCLDRWFTPDRDLAALDEAIDRAAHTSGKSPAPRNVILTIPYLNREVHDFGDVNKDGYVENLATGEGRNAVVAWYLNEAIRRFAAAHYRHLHLWGFYWMAEGVAEKDVPIVRAVADTVHAVKHRFLWIPWFSAPGWQQWKELGFDTAIMQPNYAFKSNTHKGRVRRNRLSITATLAREAGMGVEMEAGAVLTTRSDWQPFLHYFVDGAPERLGYQQGAMAYYLETHIVESACYSSNAEHRLLYDRLADYVAGQKISDPLSPIITGSHMENGSLHITGWFPAPRPLGGMDLLLDEPTDVQPWTGIAEVRVRNGRSTPWSAGGWAIRTGADAKDGRWQVLSIPLDVTASEFEIIIKPLGGANSPAPASVHPDPIDRDELTRHAALGAHYSLSPMTDAAYGDTPGRLLTDGVIPAKGWGKGRTVGWMGSKVRASVILDLGKEYKIERAEIHCPGGGYGSVNFPSRTVAMLGCNRPAPPEAAGIGPMPEGLTMGNCDALVIDRRRSPKDIDGHVSITFPPGARGRYVTVALQGPGSWLMLSEIRVFSGGTNVAASAPYTLFPPPTPAQLDDRYDKDSNLRYADDGVRLTDGIVAQGFNHGQVTGWRGAGNRMITVDLDVERPVQRVRIWALRGGKFGIFSPGQITVALSSRGTAWTSPVVARAADGAPEDGSRCEVAVFEAVFPAGTVGHQIRVDCSPGRGWTMLSEIEVQPAN